MAATLEELNTREKKLMHEEATCFVERQKHAANCPEDFWTKEAHTLLKWHVANLEFANATTLDTLSLENWDQDDEHEFLGPHLTCKQGFAALPRALACGLNIRLNSRISSIQHDANGVKVQFTNKDEKLEEVEADAVIVTLPLGVLKEGTVAFSPPLPPWKQFSIDKLGFGLINKVVLCFESQFWEAGLDTFGYCMDEDEGLNGELYMFWNFMKSTGQPVLIALNVGKAAQVSEQEPDDVIVEKALKVLGRIFKDKVTKLKHHHVTRWKSDPFARGSYSYISVNATGEDYDILSYPVKSADAKIERVFFAGEHTIRHYPATVHGALLSGLREAERVVSLYTPTCPCELGTN